MLDCAVNEERAVGALLPHTAAKKGAGWGGMPRPAHALLTPIPSSAPPWLAECPLLASPGAAPASACCGVLTGAAALQPPPVTHPHRADAHYRHQPPRSLPARPAYLFSSAPGNLSEPPTSHPARPAFLHMSLPWTRCASHSHPFPPPMSFLLVRPGQDERHSNQARLCRRRLY